MQIEEKADLSQHNTLALPCIADYRITVNFPEDISQAVAFAKNKNLPWIVLGQGSNVVLPSQLHVVVITLKILGVVTNNDVDRNTDQIQVTLGAGEVWHHVVQSLLNKNIYGLENLALIPGLVGAAPVQNIGAYGAELADGLVSVQAYDVEQDKLVELTKAQCQFAYRSSVFKTLNHQRYIITAVTLQLSSTPNINTAYKALGQYLADNNVSEPTPQDVFVAVVAIRSSKLPNPDDTPNAGSFFKNPVVTNEQFAQLQKKYSSIAAYPQASGEVKLAAGWLIDNAGWCGKQVGNVATHKDQALVLVNCGKADSSDILAYANVVNAAVYDKYQVKLQREPVAYDSNGSLISADSFSA